MISLVTTGVGYSLPWATFALEYNAAGQCVESPPIARWCVGRTRDELDEYWRGRGATVVVLK